MMLVQGTLGVPNNHKTPAVKAGVFTGVEMAGIEPASDKVATE